MSLDIAARREANKMKLLGITEETGKAVVPYTKLDATTPEVCWDIISIITRKEQIEKKGRGGSVYMAEGKNLMFPNLLETVVVGERAAAQKKKNEERKTYTRTNIETMDEMYTIRNKMIRYAVDDKEEKYVDYYSHIVETLDGYACEVIADIIMEDDEFLDRVNEARQK